MHGMEGEQVASLEGFFPIQIKKKQEVALFGFRPCSPSSWIVIGWLVLGGASLLPATSEAESNRAESPTSGPGWHVANPSAFLISGYVTEKCCRLAT